MSSRDIYRDLEEIVDRVTSLLERVEAMARLESHRLESHHQLNCYAEFEPMEHSFDCGYPECGLCH